MDQTQYNEVETTSITWIEKKVSSLITQIYNLQSNAYNMLNKIKKNLFMQYININTDLRTINAKLADLNLIKS